MKNIMHTLMAVILAALAAKLLVEGVDTLPKYCRRRGAKALGELHPFCRLPPGNVTIWVSETLEFELG